MSARPPIIPYGIDGTNIVSSNLLYNLTTDTGSSTTLNYPGAVTICAYGISGGSIVGLCMDNSGEYGFIYTVPEPATLLLLGLGAVILRRKRS
jgi:hypothetical protein